MAADPLGRRLPHLATNLGIETWLRFLVRLALGLAIYFGYGRRHARLARRSAETVAPR